MLLWSFRAIRWNITEVTKYISRWRGEISEHDFLASYYAIMILRSMACICMRCVCTSHGNNEILRQMLNKLKKPGAVSSCVCMCVCVCVCGGRGGGGGGGGQRLCLCVSVFVILATTQLRQLQKALNKLYVANHWRSSLYALGSWMLVDNDAR